MAVLCASENARVLALKLAPTYILLVTEDRGQARAARQKL
jgi:hypothetical protein